MDVEWKSSTQQEVEEPVQEEVNPTRGEIVPPIPVLPFLYAIVLLLIKEIETEEIECKVSTSELVSTKPEKIDIKFQLNKQCLEALYTFCEEWVDLLKMLFSVIAQKLRSLRIFIDEVHDGKHQSRLKMWLLLILVFQLYTVGLISVSHNFFTTPDSGKCNDLWNPLALVGYFTLSVMSFLLYTFGNMIVFLFNFVCCVFPRFQSIVWTKALEIACKFSFNLIKNRVQNMAQAKLANKAAPHAILWFQDGITIIVLVFIFCKIPEIFTSVWFIASCVGWVIAQCFGGVSA